MNIGTLIRVYTSGDYVGILGCIGSYLSLGIQLQIAQCRSRLQTLGQRVDYIHVLRSLGFGM